jgi:yecA family protein
MVRYEAFIDRGWQEKGIAQVTVVRVQENGWVEAGVFLVDLWCLGVKDAFNAEMSASEWADESARLMPPENRESFHPARARKLVEGAVAYALSLGFSPPRDYKKARRVFGSVKAQDCPQTFTYGKDGKPLYIAGPDDGDERIDLVLRVLTAKLGEDGFHYLLPANPEEPDDFDNDKWLDLFSGRPDGSASLAAFDGFFAALQVCPAAIGPDEFLPVVLASAPPWFREETDVSEATELLLSQWEIVGERLDDIDENDPPAWAVEFGDDQFEDGGLRQLAAAWCQGFLSVVQAWPEAWGGAPERAELRPHFDALAMVAAYAGGPARAGVIAPAVEGELPRYVATTVLALRAILRPEPKNDPQDGDA